MTPKAALPLADNLLHFEASGPLRLLGMGNGHPGSHEADKPTERYRFTGFGPGPSATKRAPTPCPTPPATPTRAPGATLPVGPRPRAPRPRPYAAIRTHFAKPVLAPGETAELFVATIAPGQQLLLNGRAVNLQSGPEGLNVPQARPRHPARPQRTRLAPGLAPGGMRAAADAAKTAPAGPNCASPPRPRPWQRRAFNGHAQLIVQATRAPAPPKSPSPRRAYSRLS